MAKRFTGTMKVSGTNSTQGRQQNSFFYWMDDDTTDAEAIAAATAIAGLNNGTLVSVTAQIFSDTTSPIGSATANGGSSRGRALFRNTLRHVFNMTLPYMRDNISKQEAEDVLEPVLAGLLNEDGEPLGNLVNLQMGQIVE